MRWFKPSLLLPIASLVIDQASAASITTLFDVLDSGECGAQMANLNTMVADASTLTEALNQAMTAAQKSTIVGGSKGRDVLSPGNCCLSTLASNSWMRGRAIRSKFQRTIIRNTGLNLMVTRHEWLSLHPKTCDSGL